MLLGQPMLTVIWGLWIFGEHLSALQWAGVALVLSGVAALSVSRARVASRGAARCHPQAMTANDVS